MKAQVTDRTKALLCLFNAEGALALLKGNLPILGELSTLFPLQPFWKDRQGVLALDSPK